MLSFSFFTVLRVLYSIAFTVTFAYLCNYVKAIELLECSVSTGWRITNAKMLASILMIIGGVNVFCPASKFLSTLPIIGSSYVLLFVLAVFMVLFIVNRLAVNIDEGEDSKCVLKGYEWLTDFWANRGISECIYYTLGLSIIFFYL
jgi:hypothetical protein